MELCQCCGQVIQQKIEPQPFPITHYVNGVQHIVMVKVYNDTFYEVVEGKFKGNLIHIFNSKKF